MRRFGLMVLAMVLASGPAAAAAGVMKQCRKLCKPFIAECVATTDQSRRACKKAFLRPCKQEGLQVCSLTTTTTPTTDSNPTTSTTVQSGGGGGGVVSVDVVEALREGDEDPRLYTLTVSVEYSVVTADAVTSVPLDPASFSVLDEDTEIVYPAEPAAAAGDCSADVILAKSGSEITCTLRFRMPASVVEPSSEGGGTHAKIQFEAQGLHGSRYWSLGS
jgi:hypothetical protein